MFCRALLVLDFVIPFETSLELLQTAVEIRSFDGRWRRRGASKVMVLGI